MLFHVRMICPANMLAIVCSTNHNFVFLNPLTVYAPLSHYSAPDTDFTDDDILFIINSVLYKHNLHITPFFVHCNISSTIKLQKNTVQYAL